MSLTRVYSVGSEAEARIIATFLELYGIRSFVECGSEVTDQGFLAGPPKACWVSVPAEVKDAAMALLRERDGNINARSH